MDILRLLDTVDIERGVGEDQAGEMVPIGHDVLIQEKLDQVMEHGPLFFGLLPVEPGLDAIEFGLLPLVLGLRPFAPGLDAVLVGLRLVTLTLGCVTFPLLLIAFLVTFPLLLSTFPIALRLLVLAFRLLLPIFGLLLLAFRAFLIALLFFLLALGTLLVTFRPFLITLSLFLVAFVTGVFFIAQGISELGVSISGAVPNRGLRAVLGLFSLAAGLVMVIWPGITLVLLLTIVAAWLLFYGLMLAALAFSLRRTVKSAENAIMPSQRLATSTG